MGSLNFAKGTFADHLHEVVGYKAGIAASIEQMCDLLNESGHADEIIDSEKYGLRIRSEEYEDLYYNLLHKVGVTEKPYQGIIEVFNLSRDLAKLYQANKGSRLHITQNEKCRRKTSEGHNSSGFSPPFLFPANARKIEGSALDIGHKRHNPGNW